MAEEDRAPLVLEGPDGVGISIQRGKVFSLGRHFECDWRHDDKRISSRHCTISVDPSGILLRDTSLNGTFVNEKKVGKGNEVRLSDGDTVALVLREAPLTFKARVEDFGRQESCATETQELEQTLPLDAEEDDGEALDGGAGGGIRDGEEVPAAAPAPAKEGQGAEQDKGGAAAGDKGGAAEQGGASKPSGGGIEEQITCGICADVLYQAVTVITCMHNFCAACLSTWMEQPNGKTCPQCRNDVQEVRRNHALCGIVDSFLQDKPDRRRPADELKDMDARNKLTDDVLRVTRKRRHDSGSDGSDYSGSDSDDGIMMPPAQPILCYNCQHQAPDSFMCPTAGSNTHQMCNICGESIPRRSQAAGGGAAATPWPQTACPGCSLSCCGGYYAWMSRPPGVSPTNRLAAQSGLNIVGCWTIVGDGQSVSTADLGADLPEDCFVWNSHERQITQNLMTAKGLTATQLFRTCIDQARAGTLQIPDSFPSRMPGTFHHRSTLPLSQLASKPWLCKRCVNRLFAGVVLGWRMQMPKAELPADAARRNDCHWGYNCRTQMHNPTHALRFNHCCPQTRFV